MDLLPNQTKWFRNDQQIDISSARFMSYNKQHPVLTIVNVSREDSGNYFCEVSNQIGPGRSQQSVNLNVIYRPKVALKIYPGKHNECSAEEAQIHTIILNIIF